MGRERPGWTWRAGPATAALLIALAACSARGLSIRRGGGPQAEVGGVGDAAVQTRPDGAASAEAGASPACWGDERDLLPACAEVAACTNRVVSECTQTDGCELTFSAPLGGSGSIGIVVYVNCVEVSERATGDDGDGWILTEDRRTLRLVGAACDAASAHAPSRVLVKQAHSCIL